MTTTDTGSTADRAGGVAGHTTAAGRDPAMGTVGTDPVPSAVAGPEPDQLRELQRFPADADVATIAAAVAADGAAIVERLVSPDVIAAVNDEMAPHLAACTPGADDFSGHQTRRAGAVIARSPSSHGLVAHPTVLGVCEAVIGPNAPNYQLHLTQVIDIGPDAPAQMPHRDQWAWNFFPFPLGYEVEISTLWALDEFTVANGATRVLPGSNHWDDDRAKAVLRAEHTPTVAATMPVGSVVIYTGSVIHGGGANTTDTHRRALNVDYCLGWLRQEENQYLACPPEVARTLPDELAELAGYARSGYAMGYWGDTQDPMAFLHPDRDWPTGLVPQTG